MGRENDCSLYVRDRGRVDLRRRRLHAVRRWDVPDGRRDGRHRQLLAVRRGRVWDRPDKALRTSVSSWQVVKKLLCCAQACLPSGHCACVQSPVQIGARESAAESGHDGRLRVVRVPALAQQCPAAPRAEASLTARESDGASWSSPRSAHQCSSAQLSCQRELYSELYSGPASSGETLETCQWAFKVASEQRSRAVRGQQQRKIKISAGGAGDT